MFEIIQSPIYIPIFYPRFVVYFSSCNIEFLSSIQETDYSTPRPRGDYWYYTRTFKGYVLSLGIIYPFGHYTDAHLMHIFMSNTK